MLSPATELVLALSELLLLWLAELSGAAPFSATLLPTDGVVPISCRKNASLYTCEATSWIAVNGCTNKAHVTGIEQEGSIHTQAYMCH